MELLAPAGNYGCVEAAIKSGADAVYFAGQSFGARSYAGNLTDEDIFRAADFCHLRGAKAYVTINTLVFDREFKELEKFVGTVTRAGIDGVIVQDLGVLRFIRSISPDIELHGSTQMTVCTADGVKELEKLGASRVVLARELTGAEIGEIVRSVNAEIEVFVHGAMCMCYSGQCLMSSVIGGRSGNRGKCAQPCRLPYSADGKAEKFYLSLKDMSLAEHICELKDMGVASLKIEGRMKGVEYVSTVVANYRRLIDEERLPTKDENEELKCVFFRGGLTDEYYKGGRGKQMFAFDKPDNPYLKQVNIKQETKEKKNSVLIKANIYAGQPPEMTAICGAASVSVCLDEVPQIAKGKPLACGEVRDRLCKTGGTPFEVTEADVSVDENLFLPASSLNELRRRCFTALEDAMLLQYKGNRLYKFCEETDARQASASKYSCSVLNIEQYRAVMDYSFELIYIPAHIVAENTDELIRDKERVVLCPPVILRGADRKRYKDLMRGLKKAGFIKAEVSTLDGVAAAMEFELYGGHRLNITNSRAIAEAADFGFSGLCLSPELSIAQIRDLIKPIKCEVISYGKIPLMITENCVLKNMDKCPCGGVGTIYDRTGTKLTIMRDGDICRSVILNPMPLYMADRQKALVSSGADRFKLVFTTEDAKLCKMVCEAYINNGEKPIDNFTRLQMMKGTLA